MKNKIIILAGGIGQRFGCVKQFVTFQGVPLFIHTLKNYKSFDKLLVIPKNYLSETFKNIKKYKITRTEIIYGGNTRQESVFAALIHLNAQKFSGNVAITEANRPFIKEITIKRCLKLLKIYDSAITICKSINTTSLISKGKIFKINSRDNIYDLLMPQCFRFANLYNAHFNTAFQNATDDAQILTDIYPNSNVKTITIPFWEGLKLTNHEDYEIFNYLLGRK